MRKRRLTTRRQAYTLIELLVAIAIIIFLSALAAAFMPRVSDSTNLTNAIDLYEQWLLSAKMRAKRDGLATGLRFIPDPNNPGTYSSFEYVQQPDPLVGGTSWGSTKPSTPSNTYQFNGSWHSGGVCASGSTGNAQFVGVDFTGGQSLPGAYLVQPGDYLELRNGGGLHLITKVVANSLNVQGSQAFTLSAPTTNYRILRQPRPIMGENPLQMPGNVAVQIGFTVNGTAHQSNVPGRVVVGAPASLPGYPTGGYYEVLFSPSGSVIGPGAGSGNLFFYIGDITQSPPDPTRAGFVAVQTRTGYIGAYNVDVNSANPFSFAESGRNSGL